MGRLVKNGEDVNAGKIIALEDGFIDVQLPEERASRYPVGTAFAFKPATVKQIKHWNLQDWESPAALQMSLRLVDDMLKTNCKIIINGSAKDARFICNADKLYFLKLIRDITFDSDTIVPLQYICPSCEEEITIEGLENSNWECTKFPYDVNYDMSIETQTPQKIYMPTMVTQQMLVDYAFKSMRKQGAKEETVAALLTDAEMASMLINPMLWDLSGNNDADKKNKKIIDDAKNDFENLSLPDFKMFKSIYDYFKNQEYITGKCPKCGDDLKIPSGELSIRDMFNV